jgi:hypothetical protein
MYLDANLDKSATLILETEEVVMSGVEGALVVSVVNWSN